jgi:hypothetical protein
MKLNLYRGISLTEDNVENVIADIKSNGLYTSNDGSWGSCMIKNVKADLNSLIQNQALTRTETTLSTTWVKTGSGSGHLEYTELGDACVFMADKVGATYYATTHNISDEKTLPVLIEVEVDLENVFIDGRDFLYTIFSSIENNDKQKLIRLQANLSKIFGKSILKYIDKVVNNPESEKDAICDLAIQDNQVIMDHSKNKILIGGRYGTIFYSAFIVKTPIKSECIKSIEILEQAAHPIQPQITLDKILERKYE